MGLSKIFDFNKKINGAIRRLLRRLLLADLKNPSHALFILKTFLSQRKASRRRHQNELQGLHVPAFMIASITHRCNLKCAGCYAHAQHGTPSPEANPGNLKKMMGEARDLGISMILLAGGEPLVRKEEILDIAKSYPDVVFPVFTNGLLLDDGVIKRLRSIKNMVPIISLEGLQKDTDLRRGTGVYERLLTVFAKLKKNRVFYGCSITVTSRNLESITDKTFIRTLMMGGCKLFFYVEYVPVEEGTEQLVLSDPQKALFKNCTEALKKELSAAFICFPGDEEDFGGCIASGQGFIHVNPEGNVEPCPFAPYSDSSLKDKSLRECLQSDFLKKIRDSHGLLVETKGGCALWENREMVQSMLSRDL